MPRCPLCGSVHIVVTLRPVRRGYCIGCDLVWGMDQPASALDGGLGAAVGGQAGLGEDVELRRREVAASSV